MNTFVLCACMCVYLGGLNKLLAGAWLIFRQHTQRSCAHFLQNSIDSKLNQVIHSLQQKFKVVCEPEERTLSFQIYNHTGHNYKQAFYVHYKD